MLTVGLDRAVGVLILALCRAVNCINSEFILHPWGAALLLHAVFLFDFKTCDCMAPYTNSCVKKHKNLTTGEQQPLNM